MLALHFDGTSARVADVARPTEIPGSALIRIGLAGVCDTDLQIVKGYMGFRGVLGHEFLGTVEDGPAELRGCRVVGEINFACAACPMCVAGLQRHCPTRRVMGIQDADGAFAEYVRVPAANLHLVPDSVSDSAAVFCEPLAAAFEVLEQIEIQPGQECLVLGDGKLGILVSQVLRNAGARVRVVGKHPAKLAILERLEIETVLLADWQPRPTPLVVDATGSREGLERAVATVAPRGTIVLKSTVADAGTFDFAPLVINEICVIGSRCGPFLPALEALEKGVVTVEPMISARLPLTRADEALRHAAAPGTLKVLIETA
jgi:threonine dehydrogenase-like Zn-dependent dehydrogenase